MANLKRLSSHQCDRQIRQEVTCSECDDRATERLVLDSASAMKIGMVGDSLYKHFVFGESKSTRPKLIAKRGRGKNIMSNVQYLHYSFKGIENDLQKYDSQTQNQ